MITLKSPVSQSVKSPISLKGAECHIYPDVALAPFTSYRVGGIAQWYVEPKTWQDVQEIFAWVEKQQIPFTCLGAGSNLLISDQGIEGLVINTRHLKECHIDEACQTVTVGAGYALPKLAWAGAKKGWQGLEWAVGIPGTVGGAVVMNAGAHQGCMADVLTCALVAYPDGRIAEVTGADLAYSYRTSNLQQQSALVLRASLQLKGASSREEMMSLTTHNFKHRKQTQPYDKPSCGSVFRNPQPEAAGRLIEQLGLKGYQIGGAQVSHRHANFILNVGNAQAQDIHHLINYVQEKVLGSFSILLHPEVRMLGDF